ncbi:hypothetical protein PINS_up002779 [Pythium insidiosum]|nr:hypothetical protein PINS_up002779 [Pythium insidiosum]
MGTKTPSASSASSSPTAAPHRPHGKHSKKHSHPSSPGESSGSPTKPASSPFHHHHHHHVNVNAVTSAAAFHVRSPHLTAFHCQCAQLQAELHRGLRVLQQQQQQLVPPPTASASSLSSAAPSSTTFAAQEEWLQRLSGDLLALFPTFFSTAVDIDGSHAPTCPFVMMLSVLLPALRKLLQWVVHSKAEWWTPPASPSFNASLTVSLLATELQLHELLTRVVLEGDRIAAIIHENEEREQDIAVVTLTAAKAAAFCSSTGASGSHGSTHAHSHQSHQQQQQEQNANDGELSPRSSDDGSSSSSSSSNSSSHAPPPASSPRVDSSSQATALHVPQTKRVSFEFEELHAELKMAVAQLTEAIVDNTELFASRLGRAMVAKDPAKNRHNTVRVAG